MNDNYPHFDSPFVQGLYNWQTGIGAAIALLGALLLWLQIRAAETSETDRRKRRQAAARATLPHILSEVVSYLELTMDWMIAAHPEVRQNHPIADPPAFPGAILTSLERMIEATSVDAVSEACAELLSELQTFRSRVQSVARATRNAHRHQAGLDRNLEDYMLQAARLNYNMGPLWPFARGEADDIRDPIERTSIFGSLYTLGCNEMAFRNVFERANELDRRREQANLPVAEEEPGPIAEA
jgi:hypothetical protein